MHGQDECARDERENRKQALMMGFVMMKFSSQERF
jgi:hypothetical protein